MKLIARLCLLIAACAAQPVLAQAEQGQPFSDPAQDSFNTIAFAARDAGFTGEIGVALINPDGTQRLLFTSPSNSDPLPWASVTKQVIATMVMQQVERGRIALDAPVITYMPLPPAGDTPAPTIRQLLKHRSGLRNPEGPNGNDTSFYRQGYSRPAAAQWCLTNRSAPPTQGWTYNNCDYIVLGAVLEAVTGQEMDRLLADYIFLPARMKTARLVSPLDAPSPALPEGLAGYGTSAAITGSAEDMLRFSLSLMKGTLLSAEAQAEMWHGDPQLGFMALGQWSYEAPLQGCIAPQRIIERRGGIGAFQALHVILPDQGRALVLLGNSPDTDFGTIWAGEGLAFDLLSALSCMDIQ